MVEVGHVRGEVPRAFEATGVREDDVRIPLRGGHGAVHETKAGGKDHLRALGNKPIDEGLDPSFGHGFHVERLDGQLLLYETSGDVMGIGPSIVADWADVDKSHLELLLRVPHRDERQQYCDHHG